MDLHERLLTRAAAPHPALAISLPGPQRGPRVQLTWADLCDALDRRREAAQALSAHVDFLLLAAEPTRAFVTSFLACLAFGLPAVPVRPNRRQRDSVAATLRAQGWRCLELDDLADADALAHALPSAVSVRADRERGESNRRPGHAAYVQFSSGTTRAPRGVAISYANLIANLQSICAHLSLDSTDTGVTWTPLYHDMGLVGGLLAPLWAGCPVHFLHPADVALDPLLWLRTLTRYRATCSGATDWLYRECAKRLRTGDHRDIDLGSVSRLFVGAEAIRASTVHDFIEAAQPYALRPSMLMATYGLAENTLIVSASPPGAGIRIGHFSRTALAERQAAQAPQDGSDSLALVSCGTPRGMPRDTAVVIRSDETQATLGANRIGKIMIAGPSLARGYIGSKDAAGAERPWTELDTGDYGFIGESGELFVLGRQAEKLTVDGQTYYLDDIERWLTEHALHAETNVSRLIAVAEPGETSQILHLAIESATPLPRHAASTHAWLDTLTSALVAGMARSGFPGMRIGFVLVFRKNSFPRTSSGKIRRWNPDLDSLKQASAAYRPAVRPTADAARAAPSFPTREEAQIIDSVASLSGFRIPDVGSKLVTLGLTSIHVIALAAAYEKLFDVPLALETLGEETTIRSLCLSGVKNSLKGA